jgi:hypothetical protein
MLFDENADDDDDDFDARAQHRERVIHAHEVMFVGHTSENNFKGLVIFHLCASNHY